MAKPTVTSPPNRKMSSESALSYSKFNMIANPAKVTGSLKDPKDDGKLDQPQPEIQVIPDSDHVPEKVQVIEDDANLDQPQPEVEVIADSVHVPAKMNDPFSSVTSEDGRLFQIIPPKENQKPQSQHENPIENPKPQRKLSRQKSS